MIIALFLIGWLLTSIPVGIAVGKILKSIDDAERPDSCKREDKGRTFASGLIDKGDSDRDD